MADGLRKGCMIHIATALTATHRRAAAADTLRDVLLDDNKCVPAWVARGESFPLLLYCKLVLQTAIMTASVIVDTVCT
jgi:hypothetical protein